MKETIPKDRDFNMTKIKESEYNIYECTDYGKKKKWIKKKRTGAQKIVLIVGAIIIKIIQKCLGTNQRVKNIVYTKKKKRK